MKVAILNDTHCGVRNSSDIFLDYQERFYTEIFFPYLKEHGITQVLHLGDYYEHRKFVNFKALNANRNGSVANDRFTLRKAIGFSHLSCKDSCPTGDQNCENILLKYRKTTPFRAKEGLVFTGGNKRQSMGNKRFVYDTSDYIKFKRLSAKNKNYGDCSFGGDDSKGAQSDMRRVRR